ncbi:MAG: nucleoside hydrolase [Enterococcus sp.]
MRKVIFDCDNTFGLADHDVDDGLTLLYLLGSPTIDLLGVTLTYGNGSLGEVEKMTKELQQRLTLSFDYYSANQAYYLVKQVNLYPNEVTILATGALTNLSEALRIDPNFFEKVQEVVLMGGTTEPLKVNHHLVTELNFSCDPVAAKSVLLSHMNITIMNGHMTSEAFFSRHEMNQFLTLVETTINQDTLKWIHQTLENWIKWNEKVFGFSGFCNWDMTTAVYLERSDLFSQEQYSLSEKQMNLTQGRMTLTDKSDYSIKMPKRILDIAEFNQLVIKRMALAFKKED